MTRRTSRGRGGESRSLHVRLRTAKQRTPSSQRWLERQLNDPYVAAAKRAGYRSRAAYKLKEIDARYRLLQPDRRVVDLGAAPGGWSQVAAECVAAAEGRGQVVAIDLAAVEPIAGVEILHMDFMDEAAPAHIAARLREGAADVVLSDMAAPATGHAKTDHLRIMALAEAAVDFALQALAPGGSLLCKIFQGGTERSLLDRLKRSFVTVRHIKPPASRSGNAELYVLAMGFRKHASSE
ncbi:MAG: RlmE family RNA methyltransferase [Hyphomicrobiaceae bacterium]